MMQQPHEDVKGLSKYTSFIFQELASYINTGLKHGFITMYSIKASNIKQQWFRRLHNSFHGTELWLKGAWTIGLSLWGGGLLLFQALKSVTCSHPWVTHTASSCHAFSNANDKQGWKPQIGPCNSACGVWWGPARVGNHGLSPCPPTHSLLCAAVIGTDVPLASHRATFPLITTLYADGLHLPQQLSPYSSLNLQFSSSQPPSLTLFLFLSITLPTTVRWPSPTSCTNFRCYFSGSWFF